MRKPENLPKYASRWVFEGKALRRKIQKILGLLLRPGIFCRDERVFLQEKEVSYQREAEVLDLVRSAGIYRLTLEIKRKEK
jgi:biopolymer transport protein ExbD